MKLLLAISTILFAGQAYACPDIAGTYEFKKDPTDKLIIQQQGCSNVTMTFSWNDYTATLLTDGQPYERQYDAKGNTKSNIPAGQKAENFDRVSFTQDRFVWQIFNGERSRCEGQYSFTSFECKVFEHSLRYDPALKAYIWTQVGLWRSEDGRYGNDEFVLNKIR